MPNEPAVETVSLSNGTAELCLRIGAAGKDRIHVFCGVLDAREGKGSSVLEATVLYREQ